jgi:hypothetical protein
VAERVRTLAANCLEALRNSVSSPPAAPSFRQLEAVARHAGALADALDALPPLVFKLVAARFGAGNVLSRRSSGPGSVGLEDALRSLATAAEEAAASVRRSASLGAAGKRRGPGRLLDRSAGDPRLFLAHQAALLLGAEQGADAISGDVNGVLHQVVDYLWTYVTGQEQGPNLSRFVQRAAVSARLLVRAGDLERQADATLRATAIRPSHPDLPRVYALREEALPFADRRTRRSTAATAG